MNKIFIESDSQKQPWQPAAICFNMSKDQEIILWSYVAYSSNFLLQELIMNKKHHPVFPSLIHQ